MTQQNTPDFSQLVQNLEKGYKDLTKWRDSQRIQSHDQAVALNESIDKIIEFMLLSQQLAEQMAEAHQLNGAMAKLILKNIELLDKRVQRLETKNTPKEHP